MFVQLAGEREHLEITHEDSKYSLVYILPPSLFANVGTIMAVLLNYYQ